MDEPKLPIVFAKPTSALCHPEDPIRHQPASKMRGRLSGASLLSSEVQHDVAVEDALDSTIYVCQRRIGA